MSDDTSPASPTPTCTMGYSIDGWRRMLDEWRDSPGAMAALVWGEATARRS